jgi:hypothetical protein
MLWSLDLDTYRYLSVSDAGVELLGYSREELLKMTIFGSSCPKTATRQPATQPNH